MSCTVSATSNALTIIDTIIQKSGSAAAAAYDINMVLNSSYANYSTQIVRVRRSGDNAEANYGVASNGYVDWSAITTWVNAGGGTQNGFVVTIYDQSGNARNMTQTDPAKQMQIIASGVLLTDTGAGSGAVPRAAMRATGAQFYEIAASTAMFNFLHNGGDGWLLGVQRFGAVADPNASYVICANSGATTANAGFLVNYNDISPSLNNGILQLVERATTPRAVQNITNNAALPNQTSIVNFQFDADNATAANRGISWVNNGLGNQNNLQTSAPSTANAGNNLQWGGTGVGAGFTGSMQRLVIWNANLSTQRTALTDLTNSYYGAYTPVIVSDPDAQAFVDAASITSQPQADAVNTLVIGMKAQGLWTKSKAIYPFVGGTAEQHKYNLKNPLDTDAAFRLSFLGTVTHTANGVQGNGTNGYADSFLIPDNNGMTVNNNHLSLYSRTAAAGTGTQFYEMGAGDFGGTILTSIFTRRAANLAGFDSGNFSSNRNTYTSTDGSGFFLGKVNSDLTSKLFRNGTQVATRAITNQASLSPFKIFILGFNENNSPLYYSVRQLAFASMGTGLTDTEAINYNTLVQAFQTTLGRQINP